jgi:hypothetical protein
MGGMPPQQQQQPVRIFHLQLKRHTGMLVLMSTRTYVVQGTFEQCAAAYQEAQMHNFVLGWWGLFSMLFMNWVAIFSNVSSFGELKRIAGRA